MPDFISKMANKLATLSEKEFNPYLIALIAIVIGIRILTHIHYRIEVGPSDGELSNLLTAFMFNFAMAMQMCIVASTILMPQYRITAFLVFGIYFAILFITGILALLFCFPPFPSFISFFLIIPSFIFGIISAVQIFIISYNTPAT